ncbi:hypothetical protein HCN44_000964 [Aphidius gifuensis]|uniref:Uncharacterized protein n=1 Tax=Aphidius gifuensis TaxID=684658 RepID=A0A834XKB9_APHGI|nr:hypothetical protein HCN44_000964 [Aphidius gifuensis]
MNLIIHVKIDQFYRKNNQAEMNLEYEKRKLEALQESLDIYETYAKNIYDIASDAYYATKKASNVVRTCDPGVHVKDVTYQNFVRIQQGYIGPTNTDDPDDPFIEIVKNQYSTWVSVTNCTIPEHEVTVYSDVT